MERGRRSNVEHLERLDIDTVPRPPRRVLLAGVLRRAIWIDGHIKGKASVGIVTGPKVHVARWSPLQNC